MIECSGKKSLLVKVMVNHTTQLGIRKAVTIQVVVEIKCLLLKRWTRRVSGTRSGNRRLWPHCALTQTGMAMRLVVYLAIRESWSAIMANLGRQSKFVNTQ